jgi:hypothetical protein
VAHTHSSLDTDESARCVPTAAARNTTAQIRDATQLATGNTDSDGNDDNGGIGCHNMYARCMARRHQQAGTHVGQKQIRQPRLVLAGGMKEQAMIEVKCNPTGQCGAASGYLGVVK